MTFDKGDGVLFVGGIAGQILHWDFPCLSGTGVRPMVFNTALARRTTRAAEIDIKRNELPRAF